jgi:hypothetical protein
MWVSIFHRKFGLSDTIDHLLTITTWIALIVIFINLKIIKKQKLLSGEKESQDGAQTNLSPKKKSLILLTPIVIVGLTTPYWLPLTDSTLGFWGDFFVGIFTIVFAGGIIFYQASKRKS